MKANRKQRAIPISEPIFWSLATKQSYAFNFARIYYRTIELVVYVWLIFISKMLQGIYFVVGCEVKFSKGRLEVDIFKSGAHRLKIA